MSLGFSLFLDWCLALFRKGALHTGFLELGGNLPQQSIKISKGSKYVCPCANLDFLPVPGRRADPVRRRIEPRSIVEGKLSKCRLRGRTPPEHGRLRIFRTVDIHPADIQTECRALRGQTQGKLRNHSLFTLPRLAIGML